MTDTCEACRVAGDAEAQDPSDLRAQFMPLIPQRVTMCNPEIRQETEAMAPRTAAPQGKDRATAPRREISEMGCGSARVSS